MEPSSEVRAVAAMSCACTGRIVLGVGAAMHSVTVGTLIISLPFWQTNTSNYFLSNKKTLEPLHGMGFFLFYILCLRSPREARAFA
jgi:hypothetical protein